MKRTFSLVELMVVLVIIVVIAGLLMAGISGARRKAMVTSTKSQISLIELALSNYNTNYPYQVPFKQQCRPASDNDFAMVPSGVTVANNPTGGNAPPLISELWVALDGNNAIYNPRQIQFAVPDAVALDPWENEFRVAFDATADDLVHTDFVFGGGPVNASWAIWSPGPDKVDNATDGHEANADNINSWD